MIAPLFATLGSPTDRFWPGTDWSPMILDRPLPEGASGGHGKIRYTCTTYVPGRFVEFTFDSVNGKVIDGRHVLEAVPRRAGVLVQHTLDLECGVSDWIKLTTLVVPAHDAVVEQLLDNLERSVTGTATHPHRWGLRVLLIRRLFGLPTTMAS
ncbi:SRPBCC family protein [Mycobacterium sp. D16R24]|uniref:SRPBCC family protein n=1 Tax=Mycobacterium sp. D16R24 TaxID=1855656 RepID=UPI001116F253|nr:SRPBCC family protein [Mycobacterium sp. D16R24]